MNPFFSFLTQASSFFISQYAIQALRQAPTLGAAPTLVSLIGASVAGNILAHPRNTVQAVGGGINATFNAVRGVHPASHELVRTTTEILDGLDLSIEAVQTTADYINQAVQVQLANDTTKQRYALAGCIMISLACVYLFNDKNHALIANSAKQITEAIPSKDQIAETVQLELAKRDQLVKPSLVSLTASQVGVIACCFFFSGCLTYLVLNKKDENPNFDTKNYKYN